MEELKTQVESRILEKCIQGKIVRPIRIDKIIKYNGFIVYRLSSINNDGMYYMTSILPNKVLMMLNDYFDVDGKTRFLFLNSDVNTLFSILVHDTSQIARKTGLTKKEIEEVRMKVATSVFKSKFVTAADPWERVPVGCKAIDSVLRGGIPINGITEVFGCSGVGKTQFCLQLCLQVQLPINADGQEKGAVYICTEDPFPSKRFHQLSTAYQRKHNLPKNNFESNVFIDHVTDYEQLRRCLSIHLPNLLHTKNIGLVIVDSIAGAFRSENIDVDYTNRGRELCMVACKLNNLSDEYKVAVVCVNQVSEDVEKGRTEPCLGLAWSNNLNYRCQISRHNDILFREFEVVFAPDLPRRKCSFEIGEDGLSSLDD